jgi:hypothetical protein
MELKNLTREKQKIKERRSIKLFSASLFALIIVYLAGYFGGMAFVDTTTAVPVTFGSANVPLALSGVVIRDETVFKTDSEGEITYLTDDLDRLKAGTEAAIIGGKTLKTNVGGIISRDFDGLERLYTFENMPVLRKEHIAPPKNVNKTSGVFRIITSVEWFIGSYIPNDEVQDWKKGAERSLIIDGRTLNVTVHDITPYANESYVIFKSFRYILDYINKRFITFEVSRDEKTGLLIPRSAVVNKNGANGVYKINASIAHFVEIDLGENANRTKDDVIVLDPYLNLGLKTYDYIVLNASEVYEGKRIYKKETADY